MSAPAYRLRGAAAGYRPDAPVLRGLEMDLEMGGIVALFGDNGAGKSTLLHLLALELPPMAGRLEFFGTPLIGRAAPGGRLRRQVGLLPQVPYLFDRPALDNVAMGLRFRGLGRRAAQARARALMEELELGALAARPIGALSGGERQKLAIARLLVLEPRILLLDEPFSSLDTTARRDLEALLRRACRLHDRLLVFSSHDRLQAHLLADRVLQVADGTVRPAWEVNLYRGRVDPAAGVFDTGRMRIRTLPGGPLGEYAYVDPDVVVLSAACPDASLHNRFRGRVSALGEAGQRGMPVTVDCGETVHVQVAEAEARALDLKVGEPVWVSFKAASVRVI